MESPKSGLSLLSLLPDNKENISERNNVKGNLKTVSTDENNTFECINCKVKVIQGYNFIIYNPYCCLDCRSSHLYRKSRHSLINKLICN